METELAMIVFRIEDEHGNGPYTSLKGLDCPGGPIPALDGMRYIPPEYVFGFASLEQLRGWFGDYYLVVYSKFRFRLVILEVDDEEVEFGRSQLAFNRYRSKVIREKELFYGSKRFNAEVSAGWSAEHGGTWGWDLGTFSGVFTCQDIWLSLCDW